MTSGKSLHYKIGLYLGILTAASISVIPEILPLLLGLMTINALLENNFRSRFAIIKSSVPNLLILAFYLFNILGLLWSSNMTAGLLHLEIKLAIGLLPLIIFSEPLRKATDYKNIRFAFTTGAFLAAIISLGIALIHYLNTGENHFTYSNLSGRIHPSYLSMYCLVALSFLWFDQIKPNKRLQSKKLILPGLAALLLIAFVLLLSSKINIFILFGGGIIFLLGSLIKSRNKVRTAVFALLFLTIAGTVLYLNPSVDGRIKSLVHTLNSPQAVSKTDTESNAARILVWSAGWKLFTDHPIIGVGTGDVNDALLKQYQEMDYSGVYSKRLNAHNQFLQTAVATGLIGALLLLLVFVAFLSEGFRMNNRLLITFSLILFFNFLVEGVLETQAGVIFFAFFSAWMLNRKTA